MTGGAGAMAEFSLGDYVSICPYAWLTPGFQSRLEVRPSQGDRILTSGGPTLRNPFLFGVDVWIYPSPPDWDHHISLSFLASLVDTEGDDRSIIALVGYTF